MLEKERRLKFRPFYIQHYNQISAAKKRIGQRSAAAGTWRRAVGLQLTHLYMI